MKQIIFISLLCCLFFQQATFSQSFDSLQRCTSLDDSLSYLKSYFLKGDKFSVSLPKTYSKIYFRVYFEDTGITDYDFWQSIPEGDEDAIFENSANYIVKEIKIYILSFEKYETKLS